MIRTPLEKDTPQFLMNRLDRLAAQHPDFEIRSVVKAGAVSFLVRDRRTGAAVLDVADWWPSIIADKFKTDDALWEYLQKLANHKMIEAYK